MDKENIKMLEYLVQADNLAKAIDKQVDLGNIDSRSPIADARLDYGNPNNYHWENYTLRDRKTPLVVSEQELLKSFKMIHTYCNFGIGSLKAGSKAGPKKSLEKIREIIRTHYTDIENGRVQDLQS